MKTVEYLDACKDKLGDRQLSDYQLSKVLGITRQALSKYRCEGVTFNNATAKKVAKILGIHPLRVRADAELERAKTPEDRELWRELLGKVAAVVAAFGLVAIATTSVDVAAAVQAAQRHLCQIAREFRRRSARCVYSRLFWPFDHPAAALPPFAAASFFPARP